VIYRVISGVFRFHVKIGGFFGSQQVGVVFLQHKVLILINVFVIIKSYVKTRR
jgi:hypothetical protein